MCGDGGLSLTHDPRVMTGALFERAPKTQIADVSLTVSSAQKERLRHTAGSQVCGLSVVLRVPPPWEDSNPMTPDAAAGLNKALQRNVDAA